ncbi:uncharacterized protein ANIA_11633 [Aspergillus nidulans FGSC A4]|uniref:Uncharacterized protein n=1 Tax=Emericella nidulans (strain FGSC A4 / ATCC 38163 / CBS 112.46 / NRRL 194 / M139) TaxID=227321 RepID=C8VLT6_EMENI|nr:hypothetical protein [Aspergillus nidulans FGSC A4]CBF84738.1 TPA: hypothetical protein ANIA_11633 [Aspergillus nidulans FGSC A4]
MLLYPPTFVLGRWSRPAAVLRTSGIHALTFERFLFPAIEGHWAYCDSQNIAFPSREPYGLDSPDMKRWQQTYVISLDEIRQCD